MARHSTARATSAPAAGRASLFHTSHLELSAAGTARAAREGRPLGGIAAFGYRVVGTKEKARWALDDNPIWLGKSPADIVRWMFEMAGIERMSCWQITQELNRLGVPTAYQRDGRPIPGGSLVYQWTPGGVR